MNQKKADYYFKYALSSKNDRRVNKMNADLRTFILAESKKC